MVKVVMLETKQLSGYQTIWINLAVRSISSQSQELYRRIKSGAMLLNQAMRYCKINYMCLIKMPQKHAIKNVLNTVPQQLKSTIYQCHLRPIGLLKNQTLWHARTYMG